MEKLVFYRQRRMDGGTRTGIDIDGEAVSHLFEKGETDADPRLRWFVDLRVEGKDLPRNASGAQKWLLRYADVIREGFGRFAEDIRAGIDTDSYPQNWKDFDNLPDGVQMEIVLTAVRRVDAREMAGVLKQIRSSWVDLVNGVKAPRKASHR